MRLSIFSCVFWPSLCLLWINVYFSFPIFQTGLFVFLILSCMSCFYILENNPLSVASLANILPFHRLPVLLMVSFVVQNPLSLIRRQKKIRCHLFIFAFLSINLEDGPKKIYYYNLCQWMFYFSRSFTVSSLPFRSLIHLVSFSMWY